MVVGLSHVAVTSTSDIVPVWRKEFFDIKADLRIHSEMRTSHDKNLKSHAPYR